MGLLDGKVAFVTGAAQGMGRAHALACAREGADVVLFDLAGPLPRVTSPAGTPESLAATAAEVEAFGRRSLAIRGDVRIQEDLDAAVRRAVSELGAVDILIANAGIWTQAPFWEISEDLWSDTIDINLSGVWKSIKAVTPHMISRSQGSIVVISSINGLEPGINYAHYVAAKHGLVGLMKNVALELAPYGIRCNSLHPGSMYTPMTTTQAARDLLAGHPGGTEEEMRTGASHFNALKGADLLPAETVADAGVFLNSDLARAVTGVSIPVDAGHLLLTGFNHAPTR